MEIFHMEIFKAAKITPELHEVLDELKTVFDRHSDTEQTITATCQRIEEALPQIPQLEAAAAQAAADAERVRVRADVGRASKVDSDKAVRVANQAADGVSEAKRLLKRHQAARDLLFQDMRGIDAEVFSLKSRLAQAIDELRAQLLQALEEDLRRECGSLILVLDAARSIDSALPDRGLAKSWLDCAKLISPVGFRAVHSSSHVYPNGEDLLAGDGKPIELPISVASAFEKITTVANALRRYKKFEPPRPAQSAAGRKLSPSEQRWNEQQNQAIAEWKPPKSTFVPTVTTIRTPKTPAPRAASNDVHRGSNAADDTVSAEYRRIGLEGNES